MSPGAVVGPRPSVPIGGGSGTQEEGGTLCGGAALYPPIRSLAQLGLLITAATAGAERLVEILDTRPAVTDPQGPADRSTGRPDGVIEMKDVTFGYPGTDCPALRGPCPSPHTPANSWSSRAPAAPANQRSPNSSCASTTRTTGARRGRGRWGEAGGTRMAVFGCPEFDHLMWW